MGRRDIGRGRGSEREKKRDIERDMERERELLGETLREIMGMYYSHSWKGDEGGRCFAKPPSYTTAYIRQKSRSICAVEAAWQCLLAVSFRWEGLSFEVGDTAQSSP
jgi:hypothetical protein